MLICPNCDSKILDTEKECSTCGWNAGCPNVRAAKRPEEVDALARRYDHAIQGAADNGAEQALERFADNIKNSRAVINVELDFLNTFVTSDKLLYSNYDLSVRSKTRKPAAENFDRHRRTIGAILFGHYAQEIRYAALSLDGSGPKYHDSYAITLREVAIIDRATLLEDNSYHFVATHNIQPGGNIPHGYTSIWTDRHKLAVAKLWDQISSGTTEPEHPRILLFSEGKRDTDRFIEVHIYGGFDNRAIESVKGKSSVKGTWERAAVSRIKDHLKKMGKAWVEE